MPSLLTELPQGQDDFQILLDVPAVQIGAEFQQYADALAQVIAHSTPRFAVGVFGTWGSGKTTLMRAIEQRLRPDLCIPVRFSAWQYEKEEHLIVPLLDTVRQTLVEWANAQQGLAAGIKQQAVKTATVIGQVLTSLVAGLTIKWGIPKAFEVSMDSNKALSKASEFAAAEKEAATPRSLYFGAFQALKEIFEEFSRTTRLPGGETRRVVVFVDDLDRCLPENALEVLESMKLFFDVESFVFVVGLDQQVVEAAVSVKYAREHAALADVEKKRFALEGSEYVKKIFQFYFVLPRVHVGMMDAFLASVYADAGLSPGQQAYLTAVVRPHLDYLVTDAGLNPREIKRYVNTYLIQEKIQRVLRPWLDRDILLVLQTLQFRRDWERVLQALYAHRQLFVNALAAYAQDETSLERLDPSLANLPPRFLDYAQRFGLGAAGDIQQYIYSGALTSDTDPMAADIIQELAALRSFLTLAAQGTPTTGPSPLDALGAHLSSASQTAAVRGAAAGVNRLKVEMVALQAMDQTDRPAWLDRWQTWITTTISALNQTG